MYNVPIELFQEDMIVKLEGTILKAVANVGVNVNKEELIKALNYDRKQYEKGYKDAMYEVKHPNPVKYEEMKKGMYLWDASTDYVFKVDDYFMILIDGIEGVNNRFYPVYTPNSK